MKQITITVPDNCELKQDGNTYTIVKKEEKLTYEDIARELFDDEKAFYVSSIGIMSSVHCCTDNPVNCKSLKQAEKLLAINKLMNVAKYLNDGWEPDWGDRIEPKYSISYSNKSNMLFIDSTYTTQSNIVFFKSLKLTNKAIEILGEETIKLALCTDY